MAPFIYVCDTPIAIESFMFATADHSVIFCQSKATNMIERNHLFPLDKVPNGEIPFEMLLSKQEQMMLRYLLLTETPVNHKEKQSRP